MSIIVSKGIVKPIHTLIRGMERVSVGDLNCKARTEIQGKTEALRDAFNQINELNINLGKKVEERTKELKEKQFQLIEAGKLAVIGQLGAGVAHELNNPMTGILGYTHLCWKKYQRKI